MGPEIAVPLGAFATAIICAIGIPLARAYARKMDAGSRNPQVPLEVTNRLERIEQSILLIRGQKIMLDVDLAALTISPCVNRQRWGFALFTLQGWHSAAQGRGSAPWGSSRRSLPPWKGGTSVRWGVVPPFQGGPREGGPGPQGALLRPWAVLYHPFQGEDRPMPGAAYSRTSRSRPGSRRPVSGWHALSLRRAWAAADTPFEDSGRATHV